MANTEQHQNPQADEGQFVVDDERIASITNEDLDQALAEARVSAGRFSDEVSADTLRLVVG